MREVYRNILIMNTVLLFYWVFVCIVFYILGTIINSDDADCFVDANDSTNNDGKG